MIDIYIMIIYEKSQLNRLVWGLLMFAQIHNYNQTTKSTVCVNNDYATGCNTAVVQFSSNKSAKFPGKSWHITDQFYDFTQP